VLFGVSGLRVASRGAVHYRSAQATPVVYGRKTELDGRRRRIERVACRLDLTDSEYTAAVLTRRRDEVGHP